MTVDHVGLIFFPQLAIFRIIGRIAFPIFVYMAAEGAIHTHSRRKYLLRLLLCGLLSEVPFDLCFSGQLFTPAAQNVCFTLAAGVGCVYLLERHSPLNYAIIGLILSCTALFATDYSFPGAVAVMIIYNYLSRGKAVNGCILACLMLTLFFGPIQIFGLLAAVPLAYYNGKRGVGCKYLFYLYYPIHMLVIWVVAALI